MKPGKRRATVLLLLLALLWQQAALAAYRCPQLLPQAQASSCHDPAPVDVVDGLLCDAHCLPRSDRADAATPMSVPALPAAMAGVPFARTAAPAATAAERPCGSDPPPMLMFCTLLI